MMGSVGLRFFALLLSAVLLTPLLAAGEGGDLTIHVLGLESAEGGVDIALMNSQETYPDETKAFRRVYIELDEPVCTYSFSDIPFGEYAVMLYHDKNGNRTIDKNFVGKPTEPYGFSNDARGTFSPPKYEKARFGFSEPEMALKIKVK